MDRIALFGNVNTEEILARHLKEEGNMMVDGYLSFPNQAFAESCDEALVMDKAFIENQLIASLRSKIYRVVHLGPIFSSYFFSKQLKDAGIPHIGATPEQLNYEVDKSAVRDLFPPETGILPRSVVLTDYDRANIERILEDFGGEYVLKFVGEYGKKYSGSETGRVRFSGETVNGLEETLQFIRDSIEISGKAIIEEKVKGQEFSANYVVDKNGGIFRMGENICYKRRKNGNTGPISDGTGSVNIDSSLPFLTAEDISFVEDRMVRPFTEKVVERTGVPLTAQLNLDLMKAVDGRIVLFEVNCREAGGHTMSSVLPGLVTPLSQVLTMAQEGKLDSLKPEFRKGASVSISAYPRYFPQGVSSDEDLQVMDVTRQIPDDVKLYTGWVDVLQSDARSRTLRLRNSPSLLFQHFAPDVVAARSRILEVIEDVVGGELDYRTDIGKEFE